MEQWHTLRGRVIRALNDTDRDNPDWSDEELRDYLDFALTALTHHTADQRVWNYNPSESVTEVALPEDVFQIGPVWFPDRVLLSKVALEPGMFFSDTVVSASSFPLGYFEWPEGTLNLTRQLSAGRPLVVFYWAYWTTPDSDEDPIRIPRWANEAIFWHMMSRALTKDGINQAKLGQWDTRQDAGGPEDNPLRVHSRWCEENYRNILVEHPAQDRTIWNQS